MNMGSALESLDDQELLTRIAAKRDKLALAELYERYRHNLGGFVRRRVYQTKLVDEIYNDVMLTVWENASSFRGESKVSTWIFGIANRVCMSNTRKETKHTQNISDQGFDEMQLPPIETEQEAEIIDRLRVATSKLGDNHREVIELTYYHGHSLNEIAEITDCPVNTVKTRLFHARQKLKNILEIQNNAIVSV